MADNSDIPPLEDMTGVLKQANAIREQMDRKGGEKGPGTAKAKAKVNKKHPSARSVPSTESKSESLGSPGKQEDKKNICDNDESQSDGRNAKAQSKPTKDTSGLFGGMKKGFLFGAPAKSSPKSTSPSVQSSERKAVSSELPGGVRKPLEAEIPYITPKDKTESGLTFNEVQQAMSEAKGLMDNQDWVNDDLLNKVEKNDYLLKRFADPQFMTALQEFQTNPEAAMAKYKGNTEVEKFLTQFCGLLGDHFTHLGTSDESKQQSTTGPQKVAPKVQVTQDGHTKAQPKIMELEDDLISTGASEKSNPPGRQASDVNSSSPLESLTNVSRQKTVSEQRYEVQTHVPENNADIQEMIPSSSDDEVREVLNDPKVMETLMDVQIMKLIQTLKDDPAKGQRIVDEASADLKTKIHFLMSKGLLQFQTSR